MGSRELLPSGFEDGSRAIPRRARLGDCREDGSPSVVLRAVVAGEEQPPSLAGHHETGMAGPGRILTAALHDGSLSNPLLSVERRGHVQASNIAIESRVDHQVAAGSLHHAGGIQPRTRRCHLRIRRRSLPPAVPTCRPRAEPPQVFARSCRRRPSTTSEECRRPPRAPTAAKPAGCRPRRTLPGGKPPLRARIPRLNSNPVPWRGRMRISLRSSIRAGVSAAAKLGRANVDFMIVARSVLPTVMLGAGIPQALEKRLLKPLEGRHLPIYVGSRGAEQAVIGRSRDAHAPLVRKQQSASLPPRSVRARSYHWPLIPSGRRRSTSS